MYLDESLSLVLLSNNQANSHQYINLHTNLTFEIAESSSLIWVHYIEFYKYFHVIKFIVEGDDLIEI